MDRQLSLLDETELLARTSVLPKTHRAPTPEKLVIFIDGAARGNPGPAGVGIAISHNRKLVVEKGFYLGEKTNNQAEYTALVCALALAHAFCEKHHIVTPHFYIFSDSELLVRQMTGKYAIKNTALVHLKGVAVQLLKNCTHTFTHVLREKNKVADKLANLGIDKKIKIPATLTHLIAGID
ncbi:MAG: ribonuclease HI family protein [Candidatus Babeliales bacterium]|jgi:ribonuclease HI